MKVLVCGGRDYDDEERVWEELDNLHQKRPITKIIEGGASGADLSAKFWADAHKIPVATYLAEWKGFGKAAGPIRNAKMLEEHPDLVLAFPGGKGTANMTKLAREAGVPVQVVARSTVEHPECHNG